MTIDAPIPLMLCIDVEPDSSRIGPERTSSFDGFAKIFDLLMDLRPSLEVATGQPVRYTWFIRMDPQILECFGHPGSLFELEQQRFAALLECGDELGLHTHFLRYSSRSNLYVENFEDPVWVRHCIATSVQAYRDVTGRACLSHRFGARFFSMEAAAVLAEQGVRYDLSCEPGAYLPSWDPTSAASRKILRRSPNVPWSIPFSGVDASLSCGLKSVPLTSVLPSPVVRRLDRRARGVRQTHHLWRHDLDAERYWSIAERLLRRGKASHLAFAVRSDALVNGLHADSVRSKIHGLVTHEISKSIRLTTPSASIDHVR